MQQDADPMRILRTSVLPKPSNIDLGDLVDGRESQWPKKITVCHGQLGVQSFGHLNNGSRDRLSRIIEVSDSVQI